MRILLGGGRRHHRDFVATKLLRERTPLGLASKDIQRRGYGRAQNGKTQGKRNSKERFHIDHL
jgi:hypothetical protein